MNHFLDLCQKTDFEAATTYYVNTMLAGFKKKEPILYQSDLVSRSADLVMVHDINPNSKDVIDKALSTSNYAGILKALHAYINAKGQISGITTSMQKTTTLALPKHLASPNPLPDLANSLLSPCQHLAKSLPTPCLRQI